MSTCKLLAFSVTVALLLLKACVFGAPLKQDNALEVDSKPFESAKGGISSTIIQYWITENGRRIGRKVIRKTRVLKVRRIVRVTKLIREMAHRRASGNGRPVQELEKPSPKKESVVKAIIRIPGVSYTRKTEHVLGPRLPEPLDDDTSTEEDKDFARMLKVMQSKPSQHEEVKEKIPVLADSVHSECEYKDDVTVGQVPSTVAGNVRMGLSIMVQNNRVTDPLVTTVTQCLSNGTGTAADDWGLFGADRFTCSLMQLEWYVFVKYDEAAQFAETVDSYVRNGSLTNCLQKSDSSFADNAAAFAGRAIVAPENGTAPREVRGTPAWIVGTIIGFMFTGVVALILVSFHADQLFTKTILGRTMRNRSIVFLHKAMSSLQTSMRCRSQSRMVWKLSLLTMIRRMTRCFRLAGRTLREVGS